MKNFISGTCRLNGSLYVQLHRRFYSAAILLAASVVLCGCLQNYSGSAADGRGLRRFYLSPDQILAYLNKDDATHDPIEGIWELRGNRVAIVRDTSRSYAEFVEVVLQPARGERWPIGFVTAEFNSRRESASYTSIQYGEDGSTSAWRFYLEGGDYLSGQTQVSTPYGVVDQEMSYIRVSPRVSAFPDPNSIKPVISAGSGFLISETGLIITCYHVVDSASEIEVVLQSVSETYSAIVEIADAANDIAILRIKDPSYNYDYEIPPPFQLATSKSVAVGSSVFSIGFPLNAILGSQPQVSRGSISSLVGIRDDPRTLQISCPLQPGSSGGPLFSEEGHYIGLVVSSLNIDYIYREVGTLPQNVNFAIKSSYVESLFSMLEEPISTAGNTDLGNLNIEEKVARLSPFVVLVKGSIREK